MRLNILATKLLHLHLYDLLGILIYSMDHFLLLLIKNKVPVNLITKVSATFLCCEDFVFIRKRI